MKILVISDVHGNLPALEYVIGKHKDSELVISLGDVVNYGPWSNECVQLLDSLDNKVTVLGNHEEFFLSGVYEGTNVVAQTFFKFCYPTFSMHAQIEQYIPRYSHSNCDFIHTLENKYIFPDTGVAIERDTFIGHSHRMFSNFFGKHRLTNVGSVGQNRLNIDEINYAIWNPETNDVQLCSDFFSADVLINEMRVKKYPKICLDYLLSKKNKNGK